jgi:predicted transcriptional regulator
MKTAISIPDPLFRAADRLARRLELSRSELYARAVAAFLEAHGTEALTEALNKVYAAEDSRLDPVLKAIQYASLSREEW